MLHTLNQLKSGELAGATRIKLSEGLTEFPKELLDLATTLEYLDLSGNQLSSLPTNFDCFQQLRILFCSENQFTVLPDVLGKLPLLDIVGFKANKIQTVPAAALNPNIRWLILTDNEIESIPSEIGQLSRLQKLMLAGNKLTELPETLQNCKELSLLRIAANQLTTLPSWLLNMPKLAWLAYSGNPIDKHHATPTLVSIAWNQLTLQHVLGQGASGIIYKADYHSETGKQSVAVKIFKGLVTSDGFPEDEMNIYITAGTHISLVPLLGQLVDHPEGKKGLIMGLIPEDYAILGNPPSLSSCTRDVFSSDAQLSALQAVHIAMNIASVAAHLHQKGIMHGDLYAHNILMNKEGHPLLTDFGAAVIYNRNDAQLSHALESLEVLAYGYLLDDLCGLVGQHASNYPTIKAIAHLSKTIIQSTVADRPRFQEITAQLMAQKIK